MKKQILLTTNNVKTLKGENIIDINNGLPYKTYILYMSPYTMNSKGINLCSHASEGCAKSCLVGSGNARFNVVREGRLKKTEYFLRNRLEFLYQLDNEIEKAVRVNNGKYSIVIRLNGTSDIRYEKFKVFEGKNIFEKWGNILFYDYTKNHLRFYNELPSNYHLTFSRSENNNDKAMELLKRGINVAFVFNTIPKKYKGFDVVNGDNHDLTFLYPKGVIIGLRYKKMTGKGVDNTEAFKSGFAIDITKEVMSEYSEMVERVKNNIKHLELV